MKDNKHLSINSFLTIHFYGLLALKHLFIGINFILFYVFGSIMEEFDSIGKVQDTPKITKFVESVIPYCINFLFLCSVFGILILVFVDKTKKKTNVVFIAVGIFDIVISGSFLYVTYIPYEFGIDLLLGVLTVLSTLLFLFIIYEHFTQRTHRKFLIKLENFIERKHLKKLLSHSLFFPRIIVILVFTAFWFVLLILILYS